MPVTLEALSHDALVLPPEQRLTLARRLLESVELDPDPGAAAAWEAEIARRVQRLDAGESLSIPAAEVFARLRKIAPGIHETALLNERALAEDWNRSEEDAAWSHLQQDRSVFE